jgi:hypothetical protein
VVGRASRRRFHRLSGLRRRVGNGRGFGARFRGDIYRLEWVNAEWVAGLQNHHRLENIVQYWTFELKSLWALLAANDRDSFFYLKKLCVLSLYLAIFRSIAEC